MRKMPAGTESQRRRHDLFLRMHFLRKVRRGHEQCLPKLQWRIGAKTAQNAIDGHNLLRKEARELPADVLET
jgi:hypothetical protein